MSIPVLIFHLIFHFIKENLSKYQCHRASLGVAHLELGVTCPDLRLHGQKSHIKWNTEWLVEKDFLGDDVGEWAEKVDDQSARCVWCFKHSNTML